jgi:CRP-like cAMP-binding protein
VSEQSPLVLRRLLALRHVPELTGATLAELATLAENLDEVTLPAGAVVSAPGQRLTALHVVVHGRLESTDGTTWGPNRIVGIVEVLAGRAPRATIRAAVDTTALRLAGNAFLEILEDNYGLLVLVLRDLAGRLAPLARVRRTRAATPAYGAAPLDMVERLIALRGQLPFATGRLQALATLAQVSEEIQWPAGAVIARAGAPADAAFVILDGTVTMRGTDGATILVGAGDAIGSLETLAGGRLATTIEAVTATRVLSSRGDAMLDVIEDHTDLGLAVIEVIAGALLDAGAPAPP